MRCGRRLRVSFCDREVSPRSGPVVVRFCCPDVRAGRIDNDIASKKRRRHTPDRIIRKLAEGDKFLASGQELDAVCRHLA